MKSLKKRKKTHGEQVSTAEVILSFHILHNCRTPTKLEGTARVHCNHQDTIRSFHYSNSQCRKRHRLKWIKEQYLNCIASTERKASNASHPIMFIVDRGHSYGSNIRRHLRFSGHWKEKRHARYTPTIITNEYNSSQTCLYCIEKLSYPKDNATKVTNGTFMYLNQQCPNVFRSVCRDQVSALAIGLASAAQLFFGATFSYFDEDANYQNYIKFMDLSLAFLEKRG